MIILQNINYFRRQKYIYIFYKTENVRVFIPELMLSYILGVVMAGI